MKTQVVSVAAAPAAVRYSASIEAREQVSLAFKTSGYIDTVLRRNGADGRSRVAQPGDAIRRGTLLARVQDSDYRERVSQHLKVGLETMRLLREAGVERLHSRKLRGFDEPAFR